MFSTKTIVSAFIIVLLLILAGGYFVYNQRMNEIIESEYNEIAAIKNLKVDQITKWRAEILSDGRAILGNELILDEIKSLVINKDRSVENKLLKWFQTLENSYDYIDVLLVDDDFNPIISSSRIIEQSFDLYFEYLEKTKEENLSISPIHLDNASHAHFTLKVNLLEKEKLIGCLMLLGNPDEFLFPLIQKWPTPSKTAENILIKQEGDSVLFLNSLRHKNYAALRLKKPMTEISLPAVKAVNGEVGMCRGYDYRGVKVLADIGPVPGTEWFIISKIDEDEILTDTKAFVTSEVLILLLLSSLSYILIMFYWRASESRAYKKEAELQKEKIRLSNLYATLSQINQAIIREQSRSELISKITNLPVKYGNYLSSSLAFRDQETSIIKAETFSGTDKYFHSILNEDSSYRVHDIGYNSIVDGKTIIWATLSGFSEPWMKTAYKNGIRSCASAPIKVFGKYLGSITLYSSEENSFSAPEKNLIEEIASDISYSLESIEKNEKSKLNEKRIAEHERQLATLFSNLPGIAYRCLLDKDWSMIFMSEGTLAVTGFTAEEIVVKKTTTYGELISLEDRDSVWEKVNEAVRNKKAFTIIYRIIDREGKTRWVWERGQAVQNDELQPVAIEGFISDITELKAAQDKLVKSEEYFRYLFHNNPLPMWIQDFESNQFLDVNDAVLLQYGYSRNDFLKKSILDIDPTYKPLSSDEKLLLQKQKSRLSKEYKHVLSNNTTIDVLIISHGIEYNGKSAMLSVVLDITDRKKAEQVLIEAKEKAEASEKIKTNFLAQMSHEIRTPVNVILSFSELIKEAARPIVDEELETGFTAINHAGRRLIRTIDSILNMAQITSGTFEINPQKIDILNDVLEPLTKEFEPLASQKKLNYSMDSQLDDASVIGDHYSLSQIFANLIDNAIKYTEKGTITIAAKDDGESIVVEVKDTGIGISQDYIPNLFTAFSQEEMGYSRKYEGTGLGLSLVNQYCKLNNAKLRVDSKKGYGSTFTVIIPKN